MNIMQHRDIDNPVQKAFGNGSLANVAGLIAGRKYCVVTYPEPDFAKLLAAANGDFTKVRWFLVTKSGESELGDTPIIAVPTTAGAGSEVTCWATVWDNSLKRKYSLNRRDLYPENAVIDPELMLGKSRERTISAGLDALSHALESLWNVNATPASAHHAVKAASAILETLPELAENLLSLELRGSMAEASLNAGLAFSQTKTAIAHSLSYPVTLNHGVGPTDWHRYVQEAFQGERGLNFSGTKSGFNRAASELGLV